MAALLPKHIPLCLLREPACTAVALPFTFTASACGAKQSCADFVLPSLPLPLPAGCAGHQGAHHEGVGPHRQGWPPHPSARCRHRAGAQGEPWRCGAAPFTVGEADRAGGTAANHDWLIQEGLPCCTLPVQYFVAGPLATLTHPVTPGRPWPAFRRRSMCPTSRRSSRRRCKSAAAGMPLRAP